MGFEHSFEIYTELGHHISGITPEQIVKYYDEKKDFLNKNPLPFLLVNYCSAEYPMYILAVPETFKVCWRGEPTIFDPKELVVDSEKEKIFVDFIKQYIPEQEIELKWYLSSLWG